MEVMILQDNSFAIYQVKEGQDYHLLRFASMDELKRDGLRLRRDVHKVLTAAEGNAFPFAFSVISAVMGVEKSNGVVQPASMNQPPNV